jgi:hypothetical protein
MNTRALLCLPTIVLILTATCLGAEAPSAPQPVQSPSEDILASADASSSVPSAAPVQPAAGNNVQPVLPTSTSRRDVSVARQVSYGVSQPAAPFDRPDDNILVIAGPNAQPQDVTAIVEDLAVMGRIIYTKVRSPQQVSRDNRLYVYTLGGDYLGVTEAMYLDGFGAMFMLKVDFPLLPPPEQQAKPEEPKGDQVWLEARRQMVEPPGEKPQTRARLKPYEAGKVEQFKSNLIKTLKHASNIRSLKSDDCVTLVVKAPRAVAAAQPEKAATTATRRVVRPDEQGAWSILEETLVSEAELPSLTVLTIRAKKSDTDDYAQGKLDDKAFGQKCQIITY